jgi:NAD(P)-dependent dehydrogenase (short-subunit alcohol dehydrogenase family)
MTDSPAVLITGASGGIGVAATRALLARGVTVYAGVRADPPAELAGAIPINLDVTNAESVATAAKEIANRQHGRGLHAVVNNAGVVVQGPLELVPDAELHRPFDINVYGPVRMMRAFLPQLRLGNGRIVNITAPTARIAVPFAAPISASKVALAWLSNAARLELAQWGIPVVQVEPGGSATEIFAKADRSSAAALAGADPAIVALYQPALAAVAAASARQRLDPVDKAAKAIVTAVLSPRPKTHYIAGNARIFAVLARLPQGVRDRLLTRSLGLATLTAAH